MNALLGFIDRITVKLGLISGLTIFFIMVVITIDVVGRSFFNSPLGGATELSELLLACLIFFGIAAAQQKKQHYVVEFVVVQLSKRTQATLLGITYIISAAVAALLSWYSTGQAISSYEMGEASWGTVEFPIWPARMVVAFGLALFALQYIVQFIRLCGFSGQAAVENNKSGNAKD